MFRSLNDKALLVPATIAFLIGCGPAVRSGGSYGNDILLDKLGGPTGNGAVNRCPSGTNDGSVQLTWKSTGHKRVKGTCQGGVMVGKWKAWWEFGELAWKAQMKAGLIHGTFRSYHSNGEDRAKVVFVDGVRNGKFKAWWPNGEVRAKGKFVNGKKNGCWESWYDSGQKHTKGTFADNKKVLSHFTWTTTGQRSRDKFGGKSIHGECLIML